MGGQPGAFRPRQIQHIPLQAVEVKGFIVHAANQQLFWLQWGVSFPSRISKKTKPHPPGDGQNTDWPPDPALILRFPALTCPERDIDFSWVFKVHKEPDFAKVMNEVTVFYIWGITRIRNGVLGLLGLSKTCRSVNSLFPREKK